MNLHPEGYDPHTRNARSLIDMQVADKIQREISEADGSEVGDDEDDFVHDDDFSDDNDVVHDDDEDEYFPDGEDAALGEDDALEEDELELAGCGQKRSLLPPSAEEEMPDERKIRPPYRRPIRLNPYKWLVLRGRKVSRELRLQQNSWSSFLFPATGIKKGAASTATSSVFSRFPRVPQEATTVPVLPLAPSATIPWCQGPHLVVPPLLQHLSGC